MNSKKKMPTWLKSRKYFLVSIILDSLLLLSLYPFEYIENLFTFNTIFSLIIIYFIWLISNYIIGKYSDNKDYFSIIDFKKSLKIFIEIPILLIINITSQKIIFNINDLDVIGLDKNFVFSIIFILIFREIITLIFVYFNLRLRQKKSPIYFIGRVKTFEIFKKNLINNEKNYNFNFISLNELNNYKLSNLRKIIIEDKKIFKDENFLLFFNNNNLEKIKIYSLFEWFEIYFNRYPSDFFYLEESLLYPRENKLLEMRVKRLGDIFLSVSLLILTSPILVISSVIIFLQDKGPVLYSQVRVGKKGKHFKIFKLRSMIIDSEKTGAQWSTKNDQRITKFGQIIRTFRIDELPQLLNVIIGDMSLIGPRPERPEIISKLEKQIPHFNLRHQIRPGISGWAQVNFPYGASIEDAKNKLSFDMYYIRSFDNYIDFLILFKTIRLVLNARGARATI